MVDFLRRSTAREWGLRDRKLDAPVYFHRRPNRNPPTINKVKYKSLVADRQFTQLQETEEKLGQTKTNLLKKPVKFGIGLGIVCRLKEWQE